MISSTASDFPEHRRHARDVRAMSVLPLIMECSPARPQDSPRSYPRRAVTSPFLFVSITSMRCQPVALTFRGV